MTRSVNTIDPVTIIRETDVARVEAEPQRARVVGRDAWGTEHGWLVEWLPRHVRGTHLGHENIGQVPVVWAGVCPVDAVPSNWHGGVVLRSLPVVVSCERQQVVEAVRVDRTDDLEPGTYRVLSEW